MIEEIGWKVRLRACGVECYAVVDCKYERRQATGCSAWALVRQVQDTALTAGSGPLLSAIRIGIDLDNTIVDYRAVFSNAARRLALPIGNATEKAIIRNAVRELAHGEEHWQRLQAEVYGPGLEEAVAFDGFAEFLSSCARSKIPIWIVSHKTPFAAAAPDGPNLREAALRWLNRQGFLNPESPILGVFFESTREEKIGRIRALACTHFVDDLDEVLNDSAFPPGVARFLFGSPGVQGQERAALDLVPDWHAARRAIIDIDG